MQTIETQALSVNFGGHIVVDEVSCQFDSGALTAIVGPNGAGKTTYFNLISGQLVPSQGKILLNGQDMTSLNVHQRARSGIGRAFQLTNLFPKATVHENMRIAVQSRARKTLDILGLYRGGRDIYHMTDAVLEEVGLYSIRTQRAQTLSHGDQRKLEVALVMALEPAVYMFDEPTAGMSADEAPVIIDLISRLKEQPGKIILLVEHKMSVISHLADRVVVLAEGRIVADGQPDDIMRSQVVQEVYLGKGRYRPAPEAS